jgi:hypothetical protein
MQELRIALEKITDYKVGLRRERLSSENSTGLLQVDIPDDQNSPAQQDADAFCVPISVL